MISLCSSYHASRALKSIFTNPASSELKLSGTRRESTVLVPAVSFEVEVWMPEIGWSSVKEAEEVKSALGIQYLFDGDEMVSDVVSENESKT